jgi:hypothetical protein
LGTLPVSPIIADFVHVMILQVLTGLRMKVAPNMPALALSESALIGGMAEEGGTTELSAYRDDILAAVRQLEEALIAG